MPQERLRLTACDAFAGRGHFLAASVSPQRPMAMACGAAVSNDRRSPRMTHKDCPQASGDA